MIILSPHYGGMIARCNKCGAILGYKPEEVDKNQNIICPQCKFKIWVPFNPNYDGVVKENEDNVMDNE